VNATDLDTWAGTRDAQDTLPRLVRRLAEQTNPSIRKIQFAADESVQMPGYDGLIIADVASLEVPAGTSAWELGTSDYVTKKANRDYKKRTASPRDIDPATTTFIAVTPRKWSRKDAWGRSKRSEGVWRDVRAFDADDLAQWLERVPAVHYWLSIRLGKHPEGAEDVEQFWRSWSSSTNPPLDMKFVVAGRDETITKIAEAIRTRTSSLAVRAETTREALGVIAASILSLPDEELSSTLGRALLIHDDESFRELTRSPVPLLLIPTFGTAEIGRAIAGGHQVIQPVENTYGTNATALTVPRLDARSAAKLLEASGIAEATSHQLAALARRSFSAFYRKLAIRPETQIPAWAAPANGSPLVPALLLGSWHGSKEGDRTAIEALSGSMYDSATDLMRPWLHEADSPIRQIGDVWFVVAKEDAWLLLAPYVTSDHLERFRALAVKALTTPDPRWDLPADKQWTAALYGAVPAYSSEAMKGIAETAAILGARGDLVSHASGASGSDFATAIIRDVLEAANGDWRIWATLSPLLPLLGEAAPDAFLTAVENGVRGDQPALLRLFRKDDGDMFASAPHSGLLWALETIAWSPDHLPRSAAALARLAPGGKSNRPDASLRSIFLPWVPQTSASPERRLKAIDLVRKRTPDVAWDLLLSLLPTTYDVSTFTPKPEWRSWSPETEVKPTWADLAQHAHEITARLLEDVGGSCERWRRLVSAAVSLPPHDRREILNRLRSLGREQFSTAESAQIWNHVRDIVGRHRSFSNTDWALREDIVSEFEDLLPVFNPDDLVARSAWLFSHHPPLTHPPSNDLSEQQKAASELRVEAVKATFAAGGLNAIVNLARAAEVPSEVGTTAASVGLPDDVGRTLIRQHLNRADVAASACAHGFVWSSIARHGTSWALAWQFEEPPLLQDQLASVLTYLEPNRDTFAVVEKQAPEVQAAYWKVMLPHRVEPPDVDYVARKLVDHQRAYSALGLLATQRTFKKPINAETAALVLERIAHAVPDDQASDQMAGYHIGQVLDAIADAGTLPIHRVARLEFAFSSAIGRFIRRPKVLHRTIAEDPAFFIYVLSLAYRGEGEEAKPETSEADTARALAAYELLDTCDTAPGATDDSEVDGAALKRWLEAARATAQSANRAKIADIIIGQIFSRSRAENGLWPPPAICEAIETTATEEMDRGFSVGIANGRGPHWRSLDEGGKQERGLAARYRGLADAVNDQWPRVAAILRDVGANYELHGRREDSATRLRQDLEE
jgi:hypothetical protein